MKASVTAGAFTVLCITASPSPPMTKPASDT